MTKTVEIGTISARGQVAIPSSMRDKLHLMEGEKVLFVLEDGFLLLKRVSDLSWDEITKPLREAKKKISERDIPKLVHKLRKI